MRTTTRSLWLAVTASELVGVVWIAGATSAGSAGGAQQRSNPTGNLSLPSCSTYTSWNCDDSQACVEVYLAAIDAARASEGIGPMNLPSNWFSLMPAEQTFVATNLERVDRGLPPVEGLVASLDTDAQVGALGDQDPVYGGSLGSFASMSTILGVDRGR